MVLFDFMDDDQRRLRLVLLVVLLLQYHNSIRDRHYLHQSYIKDDNIEDDGNDGKDDRQG